MTARHWLTLVVALCASMAVTGAEAAAKKGGGASVRGCTHPISAFCLGFTTTSGKRYALYNPNPWIPLRTGAIVSGRVVGPGECGVPGIEVTSWKAVKSIKCTERK
jgi:hypothetical protein